MAARRLPVRPNLDQLKHQAKDLLKTHRVSSTDAKLTDAQLALARAYGAPSWMRLVQCCELIDAIWDDDAAAVRRLVTANRHLLTEDAGIGNKNWGPPLSYAANLGRDRIIRLLYELGARDLEYAIGRAVLQSRVETAAMLHEMLGRPRPPEGALGGAAYTLSVPGTEFLFRLGMQVKQGAGTPVETVIGSDSRRPADKRRILALYEAHGYVYPDTPVMAFHRGRFDLLEAHLARDPQLLARQFTITEIFPPEVGCSHPSFEAMGTPVDGGTLLHLAVYWDEIDMAEWLIDRGADPNRRAAVDADGFGGHTALFNAVVSQEAFWINYSRGRDPQAGDAKFTELLLARGADLNIRASIRMRLGSGHGDTRFREFREVTPLSWGRRFAQENVPGGKHREVLFVNVEAVRVIEARGGIE
jgi:hypothetical protein